MYIRVCRTVSMHTYMHVYTCISPCDANLKNRHISIYEYTIDTFNILHDYWLLRDHKQ